MVNLAEKSNFPHLLDYKESAKRFIINFQKCLFLSCIRLPPCFFRFFPLLSRIYYRTVLLYASLFINNVYVEEIFGKFVTDLQEPF